MPINRVTTVRNVSIKYANNPTNEVNRIGRSPNLIPGVFKRYSTENESNNSRKTNGWNVFHGSTPFFSVFCFSSFRYYTKCYQSSLSLQYYLSCVIIPVFFPFDVFHVRFHHPLCIKIKYMYVEKRGNREKEMNLLNAFV